MRFGSPIPSGAVLWTLLAVAVVITIIALTRAGRRRTYRRVWREEWRAHRASLRNGPGLLALDMRYARGEIGRDDYLQRRADLLSPQPRAATAPRSPA
jgi:hypothetical protein